MAWNIILIDFLFMTALVAWMAWSYVSDKRKLK